MVTIYRLERGDGPAMANMATLLRIKAAFEKEGVEFINEPGNVIGVRLRPKSARTSRRKQ